MPPVTRPRPRATPTTSSRAASPDGCSAAGPAVAACAGRAGEGRAPLMPPGRVLRPRPRSCGPAAVSTRCARPPLGYGPSGDTPPVPLSDIVYGLAARTGRALPPVHDICGARGEPPLPDHASDRSRRLGGCSRPPRWGRRIRPVAVSDDGPTEPTRGGLFSWPRGSFLVAISRILPNNADSAAVVGSKNAARTADDTTNESWALLGGLPD